MTLQSDPAVLRLARSLDLPRHGDCLARIRDYALKRVAEVITHSPIAVTDLDVLRAVVADRFRVRVEFIERDADIASIAEKHPDFHPHLRACLYDEFVQESTEGITVEREGWDPRRFRFLAVVDARGERASRAYFTAWHEITHLVIHPEQLPIPGFRRCPSPEEQKDPLERVVDHVASRLGFFPPLFAPAVIDSMRRSGGFGFDALELVRTVASPTPSLFATALASLEFAPGPTLFLAVEAAPKRADARKLRSPQVTLEFAPVEVSYHARAVTVAPNESGRRLFAIRRNMRIPTRSVLYTAFSSTVDVTLQSDEDQSWWETSSNGGLPALPLTVQAARRGRFAYGLLQAA